MVRAGIAAAALAVAFLPTAASAQSLINISAPISVSIPGPVGGSQTCIDTNTCVNLDGVSNLDVTATVDVNGLVAPLVTPATAPGCTADINVGATITPTALGSASVTLTVSYDKTNANGQTVGTGGFTKTISLAAGGAPLTITECASLL